MKTATEVAKCKCIACADCRGSGKIYVTMADDLDDEYERCDTCDGTGLAEMCDYCQFLEDSETP